MSKNIFISYAHGDSEAAMALAKELGNKGIKTRLAVDELKLGESLNSAIKNAMDESETVVAIIGEGEPSPYVLLETGMALAQGKRIIPVILGTHPNTNVFTNLQQIHISDENDIEMVADKIAHSMGEPEPVVELGKPKF